MSEIVEYSDTGVTYYFRDGKLSRDDGPAVDSPDGTIMFFQNGLLTRDGDLPAIISATGSMFFFLYGVLHRADKPAVIASDGTVGYFFDGNPLPGSESFALRVPNLLRAGDDRVKYWTDAKMIEHGIVFD